MSGWRQQQRLTDAEARGGGYAEEIEVLSLASPRVVPHEVLPRELDSALAAGAVFLEATAGAVPDR